MKILLHDFSTNAGDASLHKISNDNGVRAANFATLKNLIIKSTMFPHHNIHKYSLNVPWYEDRIISFITSWQLKKATEL